MKELNAILGLRSDPAPSGADAVACAPEPEATPAPRRRMPRQASYAILGLLTACATASTTGREPTPLSPVMTFEEAAQAFALAAPDERALGPGMKLWATHYHTPSITPAPATISAAFPLLDRDGQPISPPLTHRDWCEAALQGSVSVRQAETSAAYVFVDARGPEQANCDQWLGDLSGTVKAATRRARFMRVNHPLGCGVRNQPLVPFRTIAVDPDVIPLESVVFVPELRGRTFRMDGRDYVHDGYLFAGDRGGAIKGTHVDVFMVESAAGPLEDLFASTENRTFSAHIVGEDDPRAAAVRSTQMSSCDAVTPG